MNARTLAVSPARIARRVAQLGRRISKDYAGRSLDVVVVFEDAFVFAADLVRRITARPACHFVRSEVRDVQFGGYDRREVFFSIQPDLCRKDVLVVDAVLDTGVTQEFLIRRLVELGARTVRLAVLLDRSQRRRVDLKPDYFAFPAASNYVVGYGLAGPDGLGRNLPGLNVLAGAGSAGDLVKLRRRSVARVRKGRKGPRSKR